MANNDFSKLKSYDLVEVRNDEFRGVGYFHNGLHTEKLEFISLSSERSITGTLTSRVFNFDKEGLKFEVLKDGKYNGTYSTGEYAGIFKRSNKVTANPGDIVEITNYTNLFTGYFINISKEDEKLKIARRIPVSGDLSQILEEDILDTAFENLKPFRWEVVKKNE